MKTLTIREAREGLSHPDQMFADADEVLVVCRGEPVARILPVEPRRKIRSLRAFLESQPMQDVPSEVLISEDREERFLSAYIDTSALAKCYIREPRSLDVLDWADAEDEVCTSPLALVEFRCLLARRRRAAQIEAMLERNALAEFDRDTLGRMWRVYPESAGLFDEARNLIDLLPEVPLRALDALHLAYARHFGAQRFASADKSQADAARALGLDVITFY